MSSTLEFFFQLLSSITPLVSARLAFIESGVYMAFNLSVSEGGSGSGWLALCLLSVMHTSKVLNNLDAQTQTHSQSRRRRNTGVPESCKCTDVSRRCSLASQSMPLCAVRCVAVRCACEFNALLHVHLQLLMLLLLLPRTQRLKIVLHIFSISPASTQGDIQMGMEPIRIGFCTFFLGKLYPGTHLINNRSEWLLHRKSCYVYVYI